MRKGVYKGREEYPTTVPDAYKFLIRTSRQIGYAQICTGRYGYHTGNIGRGEGLCSHSMAEAAAKEDAKMIQIKWPYRDVTIS